MNYFVSTIDKIDENFEINDLHSYNESIQISLNGFSYMVFDSGASYPLLISDNDFGTSISIQKLSEILSEVISSNEILSESYNSRVVTFINRPWAMVPDVIFEENKVNQYMNLNFKQNEFSKIIYHKIPQTDIVFVGRIPFSLVKLFNDDVKFIPHQIAFINNALATAKKTIDKKLFFVRVNDLFIDVLYLNEGKVVFYNNFTYRQYADILYYIVAAFDKLKLNSHEIPVFIQGIDLVHEIIPQIMKKYFSKIVVDNSLVTNYSPIFENLPMHKYKIITGLLSCV